MEGGVVHGLSLMSSIVCACKGVKGAQHKEEFSAAAHNTTNVTQAHLSFTGKGPRSPFEHCPSSFKQN